MIRKIKKYERLKNICFWQIVVQAVLFLLLTGFSALEWGEFIFSKSVSLIIVTAGTLGYFYCDYNLKRFAKIPIPMEFSIITKETLRIGDRLYQYRIEFTLKHDALGKLEKYLRDCLYKGKSLEDINCDLSEFFIVSKEGLHCVQDDSFTLFDDLAEEQKKISLELKQNNPVNPIQKLLHLSDLLY